MNNIDLFGINRNFLDLIRKNPRIKTHHIALFWWITVKANFQFWAPEFRFPSSESLASSGFTNWATYNKTLHELEKFSVIKILEKSKNQYSPCIIKPCFYKFIEPEKKHCFTTEGSDKNHSNITLESLQSLKYNISNTSNIQDDYIKGLLENERYDYLISLAENSNDISARIWSLINKANQYGK